MRKCSYGFPLFKNSDLVGNIADGRYFAQQLINGHKLRHALRQTVLLPQAEIRQQGGQRRAGDALGLQQIAAQPARKTAGLRIILLIVYTMQAINGRGNL